MGQKHIDPAAALKRFRATFNTQAEAAANLNISTAYMSDLLSRRRDCPAWLLERLGLKNIVVAKDGI